MQTLTENGMEDVGTGDPAEIENGYYLVFRDECNASSNCPEALKDMFPSLSKFNSGDWLLFDGNHWRYINNKGQVTSFNNRIGSIQGCPNPLCPTDFDYNFSMLKRDPSTGKLLAKDLQDSDTPSKLEMINDFPTSPSASVTSENLMIKFIGGRLIIEEDELGLSIATSADFKNTVELDDQGVPTGDDFRLTNSNFAGDLSIDKFDGLTEATDSLVDSTLDAPLTLTGNLIINQTNAENNALSINELFVDANNVTEFNLIDQKEALNLLDYTGKQGLINLTPTDANKEYFLSNDGADLTLIELNTDNIAEYIDSSTDANSKRFYNATTLLGFSTSEDLNSLSGDLASEDTIKTALQKIATKISANSTGDQTEILNNYSLTSSNLAPQTAPAGEYLYFDSGSSTWSLKNISGFNYKGALAHDGVAGLVPGDHEEGDFYIISSDSPQVNGYKTNDWAVFTGTEWKKINNSGKLKTLFGPIRQGHAADNDYSWAQINKTNSSLLDFGDVPDAVSDGKVLKVKVDSGVVSWEFAEDNQSSDQITAADISNLTDPKFSTNLDFTKITDLENQLNGKLPLSAGYDITLSGDVNFSGTGSITTSTFAIKEK